MLLPFEGMGVETVWRLEVPKAANSFDYRSVADVLLTIEYTALEDPGYRHAVIRPLARGYSADRLVSLQAEFPDAWYDLNNPDTVEDPARRMAAVLAPTREDFPPNVADLSLGQLTLFASGPTPRPRSSPSSRRGTPWTGRRPTRARSRRSAASSAPAAPAGRPGWPSSAATPPAPGSCSWRTPPRVRSLLQDGSIRDLVLALTVTGTTPSWP
jgi:hypothetical protein